MLATFCRVGALCAVLALATALRAQVVRTETVLPQATDPAINGWLGAHGVAFTPGITHRNQLFLFLHGQGGSGTGAMELLKTAAEDAPGGGGGFHAIGLTYPNDWSPFVVCGSDAACPGNLRREIVDGTDRTPTIAVTRANSIENRLIKLIAFLDAAHPGEAWSQYVVGGVIQWNRIVVWGHSQGGGNAGIIAKDHALARLCLSANAADGGPGSPAQWWTLPFATPPAVSMGFCHAQDSLTTRVSFWTALGMGSFGAVQDVATTPALFLGTHELSTSIEPAVAGQYHNSVVIDAVTPRIAGANTTPVYKPVWQYMMTGGSTTSVGASSFDDRLWATVNDDSGLPVNLFMDILGATAGTGPRPVALWIHGGGWQGGDHNQVPSFATALRARGITIVTLDYRLSGQAVFPAQMHDCKGAVRWLRAHAAELQIDPAHIGVWGSSAGGHLASLLATSSGDAFLEGTTGGNSGESSAVIACAPLFGPTDILTMQPDCAAQPVGCSFDHDAFDSPESALIGVDAPGQGLGWLRANINNPAAPFPAFAQLAFAVDPIRHLDAADPPMFIAHGDIDTTVPIGQSFKLRDAAALAGIPITFTVAPGFGHGFLGDTVNTAISNWMFDRLTDVPLCPVDLNGGGVSVQDIFEFLGAWFAGEPRADFDHSGTLGVPDIFTYLNAWFVGC